MEDREERTPETEEQEVEGHAHAGQHTGQHTGQHIGSHAGESAGAPGELGDEDDDVEAHGHINRSHDL